jgi:Zn finger protein HypA/HybF involved in hydrogenase expression
MNKCNECGIDIPKNRKFCSNSCAAKYNNKVYPKRTSGRTKPKCKNCDAKLNNYVKQYCNSKCCAEYKSKTISLPKILNGTSTNNFALKRYLKDSVKNECFDCGISAEWNGRPLTLQLDHIDGNSDNNNLNNLRLLCPNCHSQTENYGSKNNGNSQRKYNKRNVYLRNYRGYE